jgi:hypothetical protein
VHFLEGIGDVFQKDQPQDDVLVFRRVHIVAHLVGGEPEFGLETEIRPVAVGFCGYFPGRLLFAH